MLSIQEVNSSIMFGSFTNEQLNSILSAVTFARAQITKQNKNQLLVGTEVKWHSSKTGQTMIGVVNKVNRKFMLVQCGTRMWRVPASMLTAA